MVVTYVLKYLPILIAIQSNIIIIVTFLEPGCRKRSIVPNSASEISSVELEELTLRLLIK